MAVCLFFKDSSLSDGKVTSLNATEPEFRDAFIHKPLRNACRPISLGYCPRTVLRSLTPGTSSARMLLPLLVRGRWLESSEVLEVGEQRPAIPEL